MRKVMELPGNWELHANDQRHPFLVHQDGRTLQPKAFCEEPAAKDVYRALKLEEDRLGRLGDGVEHSPDWICIWSARVVLGDFMNRKITGADPVISKEGEKVADELLNGEIEKAVRVEQATRVRLWN